MVPPEKRARTHEAARRRVRGARGCDAKGVTFANKKDAVIFICNRTKSWPNCSSFLLKAPSLDEEGTVTQLKVILKLSYFNIELHAFPLHGHGYFTVRVFGH